MKTQFLLDRFHRRDHKACSRAYDSKMFQKLDDYNTSAAEQLHAKLKQIRPQVAYMSQRNFMEYTRHHLYLSNVKAGVKAVQINLH